MARLQLSLVSTNASHNYSRSNGSIETIPCLRVVAYASMIHQLVSTPNAAKSVIQNCIIDIGAFISIVPEKIWTNLRAGVVTRLPFTPSTPARHRTVTVVGGTFPFNLGEMKLRLIDNYGGRIEVTIVAKFTRDGGALNIPLTLGLRGGVLDGRILTSQPDPAAPFGEAWTLEDP